MVSRIILFLAKTLNPFISSNLSKEDASKCFDVSGKYVLPGLIDMHVHVREPGTASYKEDWVSCTKAALAGGITAIGVMPNTTPAITDQKSLEKIKDIAENKAHCDYGIILGAGKDRHSYSPAGSSS